MPDHRIEFSPNSDGDARFSPYLVNLVLGLTENEATDTEIGPGPMIDAIEEQFIRDLRTSIDPSKSHRLEAAGRILVDLARQGWIIDVEGDVVVVGHDRGQGLTVQDQKLRVREQELIKRDERLNAPSVRRFIQQMESSRLYGEEFISVFSLMRDGQHLVALLRGHRDDGTLEDEFQNIIQPHVQVIDSERSEVQ